LMVGIGVGVLLLTVLVFNLRAGPVTQAAPLLMPGNDFFAFAENVTAGPFPVTRNNVDLPKANTMLEIGEAKCSTNTDTASVWYSITPTADGQLTASVAPQGNDDVTIGVFTAVGTALICADAGTTGGETETITNQALTKGTPYYIRVAVDPTYNNPVEQANVSITFTAPPAIRITQGDNEIEDDDNVNFGTTTVGIPVIQDFTVHNDGTQPLTLGTLQVAGTGFSVAAKIGISTLPGGGNTTFSLKFTPTAAGAANGTLSFSNNDADDNPFDLTLNAMATAAPTGTGVTRQVSPSGTDNGNCQSSACKTLKYTLSQAANGDVITMAAGTYKENLTVNKSVTIQGAASSGSLQSTAANTTIIDGNGATTSNRVITVTGVIVQISNVTIMNGAPQDNTIAGGGGILNHGNLTLDNVLVTKNKTQGL